MLPSRGGKISFSVGVYKNLTPPSIPSGKEIAWDIPPGVHFTNPKNQPPLLSNTFHNANTFTLTTKPDANDAEIERGYSTINAEINPSPSFVGNACAAYLGARSAGSGSNGIIWGLNTMAEMMPLWGGNGISIEADINNYGSHPYRGQGVLVTGVGNSQTEVGVLVQRGDVASRWGVGLRVKYAEVGVDIDLSDVGGNASLGAHIHGMPRKLLKLQPNGLGAVDDAAVFVSNPNDTQVLFKITNRGGVSVGLCGSEITKHVTATSVVNSGGIPANSSADFYISCPDASIGDTIVATPSLALYPGITWNGFCASNGAITLRLANCTTSSVDPDGNGGANWRFDIWKH